MPKSQSKANREDEQWQEKKVWRNIVDHREEIPANLAASGRRREFFRQKVGGERQADEKAQENRGNKGGNSSAQASKKDGARHHSNGNSHFAYSSQAPFCLDHNFIPAYSKMTVLLP